jgi:alpha-beta hydrolase superfamily lysophospholipase
MSVVCENGTFRSSEGNHDIVYTKWGDSYKKPRALFLIAHGMAEYIARYDHFASFMVENGYAVYGNDHLGHGKSAPNAEDRGYFGAKDGRFYVVEDMLKLLAIAKKEHPGVPSIFLGHSMGSFVARLFCMKHSQEIDAAIFMGTSGPNKLTGTALPLLNCIALFLGERHYSPFFGKLTLGSNNKAIKKPKTGFDWLNTDEAEVQKYIADDLCGFTFTLSGYREICNMVMDINAKGWADGIRKDLPILLTSGREDPVGGLGEGVDAVYYALLDAGMERLEVNTYNGMRHEILNETQKETVYADILEWCKTEVK